MRKKIIFLAAASLFVLAGCGNIEKGTSTVSPSQNGEAARGVTGKVDGRSYQALLTDGKYKPSNARGLTANILNSNYNSKNFEKGLLELSKTEFSVDNYLYQEGQLFSREQILNLVNRKSKEYPEGLNPAEGEGPIVFQQLLEQDYYDKGKKQLAGISIGIALNSVDYGDEVVEISDEDLIAEGKRVSDVILAELRKKPEAENIPVKIALFKQATKDNVAGGDYFLTALSKSGDKLSGWEELNQVHVALPGPVSDSNPASVDGLTNKYTDFKNSLLNFFPNSSGITGVAYYQDNQLVKFSIEVETKYFSETEIINFTQFIAQTVEKVFIQNGEIEVLVKTLDGPESFVKKPAGEAIAEVQLFN